MNHGVFYNLSTSLEEVFVQQMSMTIVQNVTKV